VAGQDIDKGKQGNTVRHTQDTKAVFPVRDRVFLSPPECGTKETDIGVKIIIQYKENCGHVSFTKIKAKKKEHQAGYEVKNGPVEVSQDDQEATMSHTLGPHTGSDIFSSAVIFEKCAQDQNYSSIVTAQLNLNSSWVRQSNGLAHRTTQSHHRNF
jgi:hypothetical protein